MWLLGNRRFLAFCVRLWTGLERALDNPVTRWLSGLLSAVAGVSAGVYAGRHWLARGEVREAVRRHPDVAVDAQDSVVRVLDLLSVVWAVSACALLVLAVAGAFFGAGGYVLLGGALVWWAPLAFIARQLPGAGAQHTVVLLFLCTVLAAGVLAPAEQAVRRRRTAPEPVDAG
ncbi:hypothetical protein ACVNF4_06995 [Streptomyces sp. S6]